MASCMAIHWPPNMQRVKCVPHLSNPCSHSHMRRLYVKDWIKPIWKCNIEVQIECVMWNGWIDGLITTHNLAALLEQEWMRALDVKEMESSSKISLRDVSWWMSIKDAHRLGVLVIAKLSKEGCISLATGGRPFRTTHKHDWNMCGPPWTWKNTPPKRFCRKYKTWNTKMEPLEPNSLKK